MQVYNDELYHHGVLGMKWGHHKAQIKTTITRAGTLAERKAYEVGAKLNPRELQYKVKMLIRNKKEAK